jgi:hypothetical protein
MQQLLNLRASPQYLQALLSQEAHRQATPRHQSGRAREDGAGRQEQLTRRWRDAHAAPGKAFIHEAPQSFTRIRLQRQLIEAAFPQEIAVSKGGVYPDREMYIASPLDSQECFSEYLNDAQKPLASRTTQARAKTSRLSAAKCRSLGPGRRHGHQWVC